MSRVSTPRKRFTTEQDTLAVGNALLVVWIMLRCFIILHTYKCLFDCGREEGGVWQAIWQQIWKNTLFVRRLFNNLLVIALKLWILLLQGTICSPVLHVPPIVVNEWDTCTVHPVPVPPPLARSYFWSDWFISFFANFRKSPHQFFCAIIRLVVEAYWILLIKLLTSLICCVGIKMNHNYLGGTFLFDIWYNFSKTLPRT